MYSVYEITTAVGGNIRVVVETRDIELFGERQAVAHAAWRKLFDNERDEWGNLTKRQSPTQRMLKKLCADLGVDAVKRRFTENIEFTKEYEAGTPRL
jgi:hypothetical protein